MLGCPITLPGDVHVAVISTGLALVVCELQCTVCAVCVLFWVVCVVERASIEGRCRFALAEGLRLTRLLAIFVA